MRKNLRQNIDIEVTELCIIKKGKIVNTFILTIANGDMYRWKKDSDTLPLKVRLIDAKKVHC